MRLEDTLNKFKEMFQRDFETYGRYTFNDLGVIREFVVENNLELNLFALASNLLMSKFKEYENSVDSMNCAFSGGIYSEDEIMRNFGDAIQKGKSRYDCPKMLKKTIDKLYKNDIQ